MEKEGVIGLSALDKPVHSTEDVLLSRLAHLVLLVISEYDHVFSPIAKVLNQVRRHVAHVVDTSAQLTALTKVVDANQERFPAAGAVRVPEGVVCGGALAELLRAGWGRRRAT